MGISLEEKFKQFMSTLPFVEVIDEFDNRTESKKADFLLDNRKVVIELKSLQNNPEYKVHEELKIHKGKKDFPLFYGEMEVSKILKHLPNGDHINKSLFYKLSRSLEGSFRSANKQIKSSKKTFNCENASGLLVLLNQEIDILSPELIAKRISLLLTKKDEHLQYQYSHITGVWMIFNNFVIKSDLKTRFIPSIILYGPIAEKHPYLMDICNKLQGAWASFNKMPILYSTSNKISDLDFIPLKELKKPAKEHFKQSEVWRRDYRENRYLEKFSDESVIEHGRRLLKLLTPYFLKGGLTITKEQMGELMRGWTHFLEEANLRGMDMKKLKIINEDG